MINSIDGFTVYYDDPLGEIETKGSRKGSVKRLKKEFKGPGCKGRAQAFLNTVATKYNGEMKPCLWLAI